jgi:hypothetical protein
MLESLRTDLIDNGLAAVLLSPRLSPARHPARQQQASHLRRHALSALGRPPIGEDEPGGRDGHGKLTLRLLEFFADPLTLYRG